MSTQLDLFAGEPLTAAQAPPAPHLPAGFRYQPGLVTPAQEGALLDLIRELPFRAFEFHGYTGNRRVVSFGWRYDFGDGTLHAADPIPDFLLPLQEVVANFAGLDPAELRQVLVSEYRPGAGIGWHRDKAVFGQTIGVSLLSPCVFRLRRARGASWQRAHVVAAPRSVYLLSGEARTQWEHSIPPVAALRYSITFRTLRET